MPRIVVRCVPHPAGEMIRFSFTFACEPPANQSAANVGAQEAATNNITLVFRQTLPHLRSNGSPIQNSLHHTNAMHCSGSLFWLMYRIRIGRSLRCRSFSCIVVPPFFWTAASEIAAEHSTGKTITANQSDARCRLYYSRRMEGDKKGWNIETSKIGNTDTCSKQNKFDKTTTKTI